MDEQREEHQQQQQQGEGEGGYVLCLGLERHSIDFGVDRDRHRTRAPNFMGARSVRARSLHVVHWSAADSPARHGVFFRLPPSSALVLRWDASEETFRVAQDDDATRVAAAALSGELDPRLAPARDPGDRWQRATARVSDEDLDRLGVGAQRVFGTCEAPSARFPALRPSKAQLAAMSARERTEARIDGGAWLERVLAELAPSPAEAERRLLAYAQTAFAMLMLVPCDEALEHWKSHLALLSSCSERTVLAHAGLFRAFLADTAAQLAAARTGDEAFFDGENFVSEALDRAVGVILSACEENLSDEARALERAARELAEAASEVLGVCPGLGSDLPDDPSAIVEEGGADGADRAAS
eukprot:m51a1_g2527 hypothetical protein (356) ;mRNA; f:234425-235492